MRTILQWYKRRKLHNGHIEKRKKKKKKQKNKKQKTKLPSEISDAHDNLFVNNKFKKHDNNSILICFILVL